MLMTVVPSPGSSVHRRTNSTSLTVARPCPTAVNSSSKCRVSECRERKPWCSNHATLSLTSQPNQDSAEYCLLFAGSLQRGHHLVCLPRVISFLTNSIKNFPHLQKYRNINWCHNPKKTAKDQIL